MRFSTLLTILSAALLASAGTKSPCESITASATAAGEWSSFTSTTTSTSTITVCPSCSHTYPHSSSKNTGLSKSNAGGELTKTKPSLVPTGAPTLQTSKAVGVWGNSTTTAVSTAQTTVAGVSTSAGKSAPAPTSSLTAGGARVEMGSVGVALVGLVGAVVGLL